MSLPSLPTASDSDCDHQDWSKIALSSTEVEMWSTSQPGVIGCLAEDSALFQRSARMAEWRNELMTQCDVCGPG